MDEAELKRQRWLKGIVIGLGILILVVMGVMVTAILNRGHRPTAAEGVKPSSHSSGPITSSSSPAGFGDLKVVLPQGARFEEMKAEEGKIYVRVSLASGGTWLMIFSADTGRQLGSLEFGPP
jgi:hypothetical protein